MNRLQRRLTRQVVIGADQVDFVRIVEERIPLSGQRALGDELLRALRVRIRGSRNVTPLVAGVDFQLVVHLAAEQLVDRHIELLPDDVPERDVDRGNRGLHGAAVHGVASSIEGVPNLLDVPRALADDQRPDHFDFGRDRCDLREIGALPPADVPILGPHAAHQIEAAARPSLLVAAELHDVRLDGGDLELTLVGRSGLVQDGVRVAAGPRADGARSLPNLNRRGPQNARAHAGEKISAPLFIRSRLHVKTPFAPAASGRRGHAHARRILPTEHRLEMAASVSHPSWDNLRQLSCCCPRCRRVSIARLRRPSGHAAARETRRRPRESAFEDRQQGCRYEGWNPEGVCSARVDVPADSLPKPRVVTGDDRAG